MTIKKPLAILAASISALTLAACSGGAADSAATSGGAEGGESTTLKLGVVGAIYEDLWTPAQKTLADEGINLEFVQFSDYVTPNNALDAGDIDLNGFQHEIYLETDKEANGYKISNIGYTFIIPLNLYSEKVTSVDEIKDGDTIAIPNDPTNGARALKVLEAAGLITLNDPNNFNPTLDDVASKKVNFEITELAANTIPQALPDVTAAIINGNFALDFGLDPAKAIYNDDKLDDTQYWNLIAARDSDIADPAKKEIFQKVVDAFHSDATEEVFNGQFAGYFIPQGWDQDLLK